MDSSASASSRSLSELYTDALESGISSSKLETRSDNAQNYVNAALTDLTTLSQRISALSLFSTNELVEDLQTRDIPYLFVPFVLSDLLGHLLKSTRDDRLARANAQHSLLQSFLRQLEDYDGLLDQNDKELARLRPSDEVNTAKRRELKIKQYKHEQSLKQRLEAIQKHNKDKPDRIDTDSHLGYILATLQVEDQSSNDTDEVDDDSVREVFLVLARFLYTRGWSNLHSLAEERALLEAAPPDQPTSVASEDVRAQQRRSDEEAMWRMDPSSSSPQALLDPTGKPLRPFTILPAGHNDRERFKAGVFGPSHRLPTMTVDELLEIEAQQGKFIQGGGKSQDSQLTESEQLAVDSEQDGSRFGDESEARKRTKDETWAVYTDENQKGAGNTMNRG